MVAKSPTTETHLKKRTIKHRAPEDASKKKVKTVGQVHFTRLEKVLSKARASAFSQLRIKRFSKRPNFFKAPPPEDKVYLVIRIKDTFSLNPRAKKLLNVLRLKKINTATFVRASPAMQKILAQLSEFVTWGVPNSQNVHNMILKHGYAIVDGKRIALSDNKLIEEHLGASTGIVCLEDIIHEINTAGPNFHQVNQWMSVFLLARPKAGWSNKLAVSQGGDLGERSSESLNKLLKQII